MGCFWCMMILAGMVCAQNKDLELPQYTREKVETPLISIGIDAEQWVITVFEDIGESQYRYQKSDVTAGSGRITLGSDFVFTTTEFTTPDDVIPVDQITTIEYTSDLIDGKLALDFLRVTYDGEPRRSARNRNRVEVTGPIVIGRTEFIRGSVVAFAGDIEVNGEVNGDVVALMGNIVIGPSAVVRGDVHAAEGEVTLAPESSVFGLVHYGDRKPSSRKGRISRWRDRDEEFQPELRLKYDRVDGLAAMAGVSYHHPDSILPSFSVLAGYALESERLRYDIGLTQTVLRGRFPLQIGGRVYKLLDSDDDKFISDDENSLFVFWFNEDWKDWYEAEGAYAFVRFWFLGFNNLEIGYLAEDHRFFRAHPRLWAVFGAKQFRSNFSALPLTQSEKYEAVDRKGISSLKAKLTIDTRNDVDRTRRGWLASAEYENSSTDGNGDYNFDRYEFRAMRFQPLSRYHTIHLGAAYGRIENDLVPLQRLFYLGGLGTIHGMDHKEQFGKEFILTTASYRFMIPGSDLMPFVQYDGGRIGAERLGPGQTWFNSVSLGIDFDYKFRLFVSKRMDRDDDVVIYARFSPAAF